MLTIRLQRVGKTNHPVFRLVLAEKHRSAKKQAQEIFGIYNAQTKEFGLKDEERLKYWISQRVELSPTVHNLLVDKGIVQAKKIQAWRPKVKKAEAAQAADVPAKAATQKAEVKVEDKPAEGEKTT